MALSSLSESNADHCVRLLFTAGERKQRQQATLSRGTSAEGELAPTSLNPSPSMELQPTIHEAFSTLPEEIPPHNAHHDPNMIPFEIRFRHWLGESLFLML